MFLSNKKACGLLFEGTIVVCVIIGWTMFAWSQSRTISFVIPSSNRPAQNTTLKIDIWFDARGSTELLGGFSGTLQWKPAILQFVSHSGVKAGFSGLVNADSAQKGILRFNGANPLGVRDNLNVLTVTCKAIGEVDSSTPLNLEYSSVIAALTFVNLLPTLTIKDTMVTVVKSTRVEGRDAIIREFDLLQNYPNPFNPATKIRFEVPGNRNNRVVLQILNLQGQIVKTLIDKKLLPGTHEITWDGRDDSGQPLASGVYLYKMVAGDIARVRKMVLAK